MGFVDRDPEARLTAFGSGPLPYPSPAAAAADLGRRLDVVELDLRHGRVTPIEAIRAANEQCDAVLSIDLAGGHEGRGYQLAQLEVLEVRARFLETVGRDAGDERIIELAEVCVEIVRTGREDEPPDMTTGEPRHYFEVAVRSQQLIDELGIG